MQAAHTQIHTTPHDNGRTRTARLENKSEDEPLDGGKPLALLLAAG